jgi:membrane protease YdiL (CAAX protease family)
MMSTLVALMVVSGAYHIKDWQDVPWRDIIDVGIWAGIVEEIVLRRSIACCGDRLAAAAIVLSGLIFGFLHAGNPNADWWSSTAIAIEAGLLFGVLFCLTRSLWVVIGLHAAWNIAQSRDLWRHRVGHHPTRHHQCPNRWSVVVDGGASNSKPRSQA